MRVFELAEDLKVPAEELVALLRAMGIPVTGEKATVQEADVSRVLARVERERRAGRKNVTDAVHAALEESQAPTKKRRRRKAEDVAPEEEAPAAGEAEVADAAPAVTGASAEPARGEEASTPSSGSSAKTTSGADATPDVGQRKPPPASPTPLLRAQDVAAEDEDESAKRKRRLRMPDMGPPIGPAPAAQAFPLEESRRTVRKETPEPVRVPAPARPPTPAASAGPGGQVRIQADGFTADGRRKGKKKGKKRLRVDQDAVADNVSRVMAELKGGGGKKRRRKAGVLTVEEKEAREEEERVLAEEEAKTVRVNEFLTIAELSELIDIPSTELVGAAFKNLGLMVTINQRLDFDQIELLLDEFNFKAVRDEDYQMSGAEEEEVEDDPQTLVSRPPVVTVMGHVDHGKTLLLDSIRKTNVVAGESGGITQHIGAYHVDLDEGRSITFLDTPGHAAFTAMRARGADITDIVVLVVAADDSIMPQTVEAISHAKNAGVPLVVAINKMDLPTANPMRVKQELLHHEVTPEEFGGDVLVTQVSARSGAGIDELLEKILLQAEVLELKANPNREAQGTVVEAKLDVGKGPVVTVLVQRGTLRVGNTFVVGQFEGRVRALMDERGHPLKQVTPGRPAQILGAGGIPQAGDTLTVMGAAKASEISQARQRLEREKQLRIKLRGVKLGDLAHFMKGGELVALPVIVKADADGSVQAVSDSLEQLSTAEVQVEIVHRGVGAVNESDVLLAETAGAIIVAFRVRPDTNARLLAERDGVEIHLYDVIYEAVDDITKAMEGMLSPEERETVMGVAEVRELFRISKVGTIAGCYVSDGVIDRKAKARVLRQGMAVYTGEIHSLKRFKDDVREVREGFECGIGIANFNDLKVGDLIECFQVEEIARTLAGSATSAGQSR